MRDRGGAHDDLALGRAREDDPDRRRVGLLDVAQQRGAVHARHAHVRDDDVARRAVELGQRVGAAGGEEHLPLVALRAQRVAQAVEHLLLVVDEEDPRHAATCVSRGTLTCLDRQADVERGAAARLGLEGERAAVALDHDPSRDREALAGAAPDVLGREEGVEDAPGDVGRDAAGRCR